MHIVRAKSVLSDRTSCVVFSSEQTTLSRQVQYAAEERLFRIRIAWDVTLDNCTVIIVA